MDLLGEFLDGGYQQPQWLIRCGDRLIQVSEPLFRILQYSDGRHTAEAIAAAVTQATEWAVTADQVTRLIESRLEPLGVVTQGSVAECRDARQPRSHPSPLLLKRKAVVIGPRWIERASAVLQFFYLPVVLVPVLVLAAAAHIWLYFLHGLTTSFQVVLSTPGFLPAALGLTLLAGIFHEFGHAAALRYGGGRTRGMGVGLYLIYPVFYTDTTDAYRLGRWARVRTDLGGFYFYLIATLVLTGGYAATGQDLLLFVVLLINIDILYQSIPFTRMDGYWALADLTGIPDLFTCLPAFLRSLTPMGTAVGRLPALKPWAKRVFLGYVLLTLPFLVVALVFFVVRAPWLFATTWHAYFLNVEHFIRAAQSLELIGVVLTGLQLLVLGCILAGIVLMFLDLGRKLLGLMPRRAYG